jgi:hypothetical protein
MKQETIALAQKSVINEQEWEQLVQEMNDHFDLALAARIFYTTRTNSTFDFDYYVPDHIEYGQMPPSVRLYLDKARALFAFLKEISLKEDQDFWFIGAQLIGQISNPYGGDIKVA